MFRIVPGTKMKSSSSRPCGSDARSGIALILVLGFLAILIIMSVGFAISMRVERLVARSSLDHIRARQLGEAALARAVDDINQSVSNNPVPYWDSVDWPDGVKESLPPVGAGNRVTMLGFSTTNYLLEGYVSNYIPLARWESAYLASTNAEWVPFSYVINGQEKTNGRYAYIIVDCSGMLDVNLDYSPTNNIALARDMGLHVRELRYTNALTPEVRHTGTQPNVWTNFVWCRLAVNTQTLEKAWGRLETVAEIRPMLAFGFANNQPFDSTRRGTYFGRTMTNWTTRDFVPYSRAPQGFMNVAGTVDEPVVIAENFLDAASGAQNQADVQQALNQAGLIYPAQVLANLKDYMDPGNVPNNLFSFSTEAVPMINEVVVTNSYVDVLGDGTQIRNEYRIMVEVWYPFTGTNNNSYNLQLKGIYSDANPPTPKPGDVTIVSQPLSPPGGVWTQGVMVVITSAPQAVATNFVQDLSAAKVSIHARVRENVTPVDQVAQGLLDQLVINIGTAMGAPPSYGSRGKSANDPRINWNGADGNQWIAQNVHTLGRTNATLTAAQAGSDGHLLMHVANRPLKSVGELGLLLFDSNKHWQTISLAPGSSNFYPVLDRITIYTNNVLYGRINPNSYHTGVLATVFNQMPVERVPFDPLTTTFSLAQLSNFAQRLVSGGAVYTNLSDLGFMTNALDSMPAAFKIQPAMYESVIRNSAGLFHPRQQLYTVVLLAQVLDAAGNPSAEQRGAGLIWRDPYPDPVTGTRATQVRYFRWLTE